MWHDRESFSGPASADDMAANKLAAIPHDKRSLGKAGQNGKGKAQHSIELYIHSSSKVRAGTPALIPIASPSSIISSLPDKISYFPFA